MLRPLRHFDRTLERFVTDILYERRRSSGTVICGFFLLTLSLPFRALTVLRRFFYGRRIFRSQYLGCAVISVGNLTVGGTGKTPVVEMLARELQRHGRKVAILSRGYRSRTEFFLTRWLRPITHGEEPPQRIVSDGHNILLNSAEAGDEPFMLAKNLPGVVVLTGKNRVRSGKYAVKKFDCDTLILDDGFQHLRLQSHLNLLLIDKGNPFGCGHLLPRGILRESPTELRRATHILLTKSDGQRNEALETYLLDHRRDGTPILECRHAPRCLCEVHGQEKISVGKMRGHRIAAFSGIAAPENFETFFNKCGAELVYKHRFPDHYRFTEEDIGRIFERAQACNAEWVVTTEKDAVRLLPGWFYPLPTYFLRIEIEIFRGNNEFQRLIASIRSLSGH
ncbi:MAG: tetraacyldisaccharide 4'-kinase [Puniceicoccales bacterium]|nr:tetraacyldisaccharide 4'-kinase [Puniceicoccales bacterium]